MNDISPFDNSAPQSTEDVHDAAWRQQCAAQAHAAQPIEIALFGETEQAIPQPTTAPLFATDPTPTTPIRHATDGPVPTHVNRRPRGDVALFETRLGLPPDDGPAGPLAFEFGIG